MELTAEIHQALAPYQVSGAQHGTSGNSSERLRQIAAKTRTTKANVATALQMISWGLSVNDYGNAHLDADGRFIKLPDEGVTETLWEKMTAHAESKGLKKGDYKKLNLPFENRLLSQPREIRERMSRRVADFVHHMLVNVFNSKDTAPLVMDAILTAGSHDPGPKAIRMERPEDWTSEKIVQRAAAIHGDKGVAGDFED